MVTTTKGAQKVREKIPKDKKWCMPSRLTQLLLVARWVSVLEDANVGASASFPASFQRWAFAGGRAAPCLTIRDHDAGRSALATHLKCEAICFKKLPWGLLLNTPCDAVNGQRASILHMANGCDEAGRGPRWLSYMF